MVRRTQEKLTPSAAIDASRGGKARSATKRAIRNRETNPRRASFGSSKTTVAEATPATATTIRPARSQPATCETPAAVDASGASATLSRRPRTKSESATAPMLARRRRQRRTTAKRSTSSQRPGRAMPPTEAAPPAAASVNMAGRASSAAKSRCQPHALAP